MNITHEPSSTGTLSPERIEEKANILESNLYTSISKQADLSKIQFKITRANFVDAVIRKALVQLMPRFNVNPQDFSFELRNLLQKNIPPDKQETFKLDILDMDDSDYDDLPIATRTFEAIASKNELEIIVSGIPVIKSIDGKIAESFFNYEKSPGQLLKDGVINFKEINKYPMAKEGDNLFYITHETQGKPGFSFDGKALLVEEAKPFNITLGRNVKKIDDPDEKGKLKGYFLQALKTGVVILDWSEDHVVTGIDISDEIEVKKLDYATGNIGTEFTSPIRMKIGVICDGFKIRVDDTVEATVVDGGEVITNSDAVITKSQSGSIIVALKDISIDSATHSRITSEQGVTTIHRELIDSRVSSPSMNFQKNKGLITNNKIETERLKLTGLYFSGENIIHFGTALFKEKERLINSRASLQADRLKLSNTEKVLMENLQLELKKLTRLAASDHELVKHVKPLIIATSKMDYEIINSKIGLIQERNNTKVVGNVKKLFETLEKISRANKDCDNRESKISDNMDEVNEKMSLMELFIEGYLRPAATIKIFGGAPEAKKDLKPKHTIENFDIKNKYIKMTGSYSHQTGFEFIK